MAPEVENNWRLAGYAIDKNMQVKVVDMIRVRQLPLGSCRAFYIYSLARVA